MASRLLDGAPMPTVIPEACAFALEGSGPGLWLARQVSPLWIEHDIILNPDYKKI